MINIVRSSSQSIANLFYVTLNDNVDTIPSWYYFVFTNRVTQDEVEYWGQDISTYGGVQQFVIQSNIFEGFDDGFWGYEVYGTSNDGGLVETNLLETGYMHLRTDTTFAPTKYSEQSNNFKTYNG